MQLNRRAWDRCRSLIDQADQCNVSVQNIGGARVVDCGVAAAGGLAAGLHLAEVCLAGLGTVRVTSGAAGVAGLEAAPTISIHTDQPVAACMGSQYAGWQISGNDYFAMGSGSMRAAAAKEPLLREWGLTESPELAVGVLEAGKLPSADVCREIADACQVAPSRLTLLVAPTASLAGTVQIVARTVETALHKMHELGFDLNQVRSGFGTAPLPPVAKDDLTGIGRTNDAVLYGGRVTLWVDGDAASCDEIGPRIPSSGSKDHGRPFAEIFAAYDHDFYKIDPLLFSPAEVTLVNLKTGTSRSYGATAPDVLARSFGLPT